MVVNGHSPGATIGKWLVNVSKGGEMHLLNGGKVDPGIGTGHKHVFTA
jgi:hypothetical protein